jgi:CheY-like chemotaxis protein
VSQTSRAEPASSPGRESALILVIERDPHVRSLERFFLEQAGYAVQFCDDGGAALALARSIRPVIVVTEILIPGLDGLSVCRALKGDPATQSILVLVFSVLAAEDRARDVGADGFLRKPVNDALLIRAVERLLADRRQGGPSDGAR